MYKITDKELDTMIDVQKELENSLRPKKTMLTPAEAGKMIGLSGVTVRTLIKEGKWEIPHIWSGRRLKIFAAPIEEIARTGEYKGKPVKLKV